MWTHDRLKVKRWNGEQVYWKQYKYNGHRFTIFKQDNGKMLGFERIIRPDREMTVLRPHIIKYDWWELLNKILPPNSSVDGELYILKGNAGDAAHAIAKGKNNLEYRIFAVPVWHGTPIHYFDLSVTKELLREGKHLFIPTFRMSSEETMEQLLYDAINLDIEGWVLKEYNYSGWYKVKPTKDIDCIVTGFKDGNGKYIGLVGSLEVSAYINKKLRVLASVSGMSDDIRIDIDEQKDLGRVCEVEYQDVGNGGRLIHPRFKRWRDDKPADQCYYSENDL